MRGLFLQLALVCTSLAELTGWVIFDKYKPGTTEEWFTLELTDEQQEGFLESFLSALTALVDEGTSLPEAEFQIDTDYAKGKIALSATITGLDSGDEALIRIGTSLKVDEAIDQINNMIQQLPFAMGNILEFRFDPPPLDSLSPGQQAAAKKFSASVSGTIGYDATGTTEEALEILSFAFFEEIGTDFKFLAPGGRRLVADSASFSAGGMTTGTAEVAMATINNDDFGDSVVDAAATCTTCTGTLTGTTSVSAVADGADAYIPPVYEPLPGVVSIAGASSIRISDLLPGGSGGSMDPLAMVTGNIPVLIPVVTGVVVFFILILYLLIFFPCCACCCCRGCCCGTACNKPTGKIDHNLIFSAGFFVMTLAGMVMAMQAANSTQAAFDQFGESIASILLIVTTVSGSIEGMSSQMATMSSSYGSSPCALLAQVSGAFDIAGQIPDIAGPVSMVVDPLGQVTGIIDLFNSFFSTAIMAMGAVLFLLGFVYFAGVVLSKFGVFEKIPILGTVWTVLSVLSGLLAYILMFAGCFIGIVGNLVAVLLAFLCIEDPIAIMGAAAGEQYAYIVTCTGTPLPELSMINDIHSMMLTTLINIDALESMANLAGDAACTTVDWDGVKGDVSGLIEAANSAIELVRCKTFNELFYGLLNQGLCTDMFSAMYGLYQALLVLIIAQIGAILNYHHTVRRAAKQKTKVEPDYPGGTDMGGAIPLSEINAAPMAYEEGEAFEEQPQEAAGYAQD